MSKITMIIISLEPFVICLLPAQFPLSRHTYTLFSQSTLCLLWLHMHEITSNHCGLVSSYLANVFWLLIYLISFNRSVIEIHQKFLSVHSPLMSVGFQHLLRLHYWGSSLGPLIPQSDRALVTEIINLKTLFATNALQELFTSHASWCLIIGEVFC